MLKTNSKTAKERIQKYIVDSMNDSCSVLDGDIPKDDTKAQLLGCINNFLNWFNNYERSQNRGLQTNFQWWLQGLPSCISLDFSYFDQRKQIMEWLEQTEEQCDKYDDGQVANLFYALIYKEFLVLCKKHKIDFYNLIK